MSVVWVSVRLSSTVSQPISTDKGKKRPLLLKLEGMLIKSGPTTVLRGYPSKKLELNLYYSTETYCTVRKDFYNIIPVYLIHYLITVFYHLHPLIIQSS